MPTHLIATTSELSPGTQQLGLAPGFGKQSSRATAQTVTLQIEIAVAIEITGDDSHVNVAGNVAVRVSRA